MATQPLSPACPWIALRGGRWRVVAVVFVDQPIRLGFTHKRPPYWLACVLDHEPIMPLAKLGDFIPEAHGRRPSTIFRNSSRTNSFRAFQAARSYSVASILSI